MPKFVENYTALEAWSKNKPVNTRVFKLNSIIIQVRLMSETTNLLPQQLNNCKSQWYSCYLFLALECNVPVVQSCLHFQVAESYQKQALESLIESYLETKFSKNRGWTRMLKHTRQLAKLWEHANKTMIEFYVRDSHTSIYCFWPNCSSWQTVEIQNAHTTLKISNAATEYSSTNNLLMGTFVQQVEMAIDDLILACELGLPISIPRPQNSSETFSRRTGKSTSSAAITAAILNILETGFPDIVQCHTCHSQPPILFRCSVCKTTRYCSDACQLKDWPKHKATCKK